MRKDGYRILPLKFLTTKLKYLFHLILIMLLSSCASELNPYKFAPPTQETQWSPKDSLSDYFPEESDLPEVSEELMPYIDELTLVQFIDVALMNSPVTQQSWEESRAAAAAWAVARGLYYPQVDGSISGTDTDISTSGGNLSFNQSTAQAGVTLDYLLLDFGGRSAQVEQAKQALINSNWNHNQTIQDVLRNVAAAYYTYIGNRAQVEADEKSIEEAKTSLEAADLRLEAGVGTLPDVLQARASLAEVEFDLVSDQGDVQVSRGDLATTVGWAANTNFDVIEQDEVFSPELLESNVNSLIEIAMKYRPDLAAIVASVRQSEAAIKESRSNLLPYLSASGNFYEEYVDSTGDETYEFNDNYTFTLELTIPIFHGFSLRNLLREAESNLEATRAALKIQEQQVISDVWSTYYYFQTAVQQLEAADTLLESSLESFDASFTRYRSGVGDIVELLNAQSLLAEARAQKVQSRTNLFVSYAELIHSLGTDIPFTEEIEIIEDESVDLEFKNEDKK